MLKRRGHKIGRVELFINAWKSSGKKVEPSPQVSLYKKNISKNASLQEVKNSHKIKAFKFNISI